VEKQNGWLVIPSVADVRGDKLRPAHKPKSREHPRHRLEPIRPSRRENHEYILQLAKQRDEHLVLAFQQRAEDEDRAPGDERLELLRDRERRLVRLIVELHVAARFHDLLWRADGHESLAIELFAREDAIVEAQHAA